MKLRVLTFLSIVACLLMVASVLGQGDPISGTWTGTWGPSPSDRNDATLQLKWEDRKSTRLNSSH